MPCLPIPRPPPAAMDVQTFLHDHGRLPRLGDPQPPWQYRGWLLAYVIALHSFCPAVRDRWGYHLRTLDAGRLLDEPIPPIAFGPPDPHVPSLLQKWTGLIRSSGGCWGDFRLLLDWLLWGLALANEAPPLDESVHEKLYRGVNVGPLLAKPYDYLGQFVAMQRAGGWNPARFYPTPHAVVELMVRMLMHDVAADGRDPRTYSVCDPCVGSGRMLLHASNLSLNLYGQDINSLAIAMCKINGALYAPWLSFPLPAAILGTMPAAAIARVAPANADENGVPILQIADPQQPLLFSL